VKGESTATKLQRIHRKRVLTEVQPTRRPLPSVTSSCLSHSCIYVIYATCPVLKALKMD
jgi:hypothetical protein